MTKIKVVEHEICVSKVYCRELYGRDNRSYAHYFYTSDEGIKVKKSEEVSAPDWKPRLYGISLCVLTEKVIKELEEEREYRNLEQISPDTERRERVTKRTIRFNRFDELMGLLSVYRGETPPNLNNLVEHIIQEEPDLLSEKPNLFLSRLYYGLMRI